MDKKPLPAPSPELRRDVTELRNIIRRYVCAVVHHWTVDESKPIGTAVMLRAGERLFAVTARHCVHEDMAIHFRDADPHRRRGSVVRTLTRSPFDLAVLELDPLPGLAACQIEQLCTVLPRPPAPEGEAEEAHLFWVVGFPAAWAALGPDGKLSTPETCVGTNVVGAGPAEFTLYYHREAFGIGRAALTCEWSPLLETPHGFSGAGVWGCSQPQQGTLFNPLRHVRPYGIQYAWLPQSRLLKCVPARVIAEMLLDHYPDLRYIVLGHFPESAQRAAPAPQH